MKILKRFLPLAALAEVCAVAVLCPASISGQEYGGDFSFHAPKATLTFNLGYAVPKAGSDLFDEVAHVYTLDKSDFQAPVIGGGLSFFLNDRIDLAFEFTYERSSTWSEYTDYVGADDLPIEQETRFTRAPFTASVRYFLMDRGREIGTLSWIPTTWSPYIGAGGGRIYYEFEQAGEFINFDDEAWPVYRDTVTSSGWGWVGHIFGGLQWALSANWVLTAEGRYSLADADLDRPAYTGYEPLDLSGLQGLIGFGIRF